MKSLNPTYKTLHMPESAELRFTIEGPLTSPFKAGNSRAPVNHAKEFELGETYKLTHYYVFYTLEVICGKEPSNAIMSSYLHVNK